FLAGFSPAALGRTRVRLSRVAVAFVHLVLLAAVVVSAKPAGAEVAQADPRADGYVSVIEVSGLLDRVLVDFVETQLAKAEENGAIALVLQLNSGGAVVADGRLEELVERIETSEVPIDVWVGPSGSRAGGATTDLLASARTVGVAPKSRVEITRTLLGDGTLDGKAAVGDSIGADEAVELGLVDNAAPTIGEFILGLDGVESRVVGEGDDRRREPVSQARFAQLPLGGQLMHTVASP